MTRLVFLILGLALLPSAVAVRARAKVPLCGDRLVAHALFFDFLPRFSVNELADPAEVLTQPFRERFEIAYGYAPTESALYQVLAATPISIGDLWRAPLSTEDRAFLVGRTKVFQGTPFLEELRQRLTVEVSRFDLLRFLRKQGQSVKLSALFLGVSERSARNILHFEGEQPLTEAIWTDAERAFLREHYGALSDSELAGYLGKSENGVAKRARAERLVTPRDSRSVFPDDWPETSDADLLAWRTAGKETALRKARDHFVATGELLEQVNVVRITGFHWDQLMGIQRFRALGANHSRRFFDKPIAFWIAFTDLLHAHAVDGIPPRDYSPFLVAKWWEKDPDARGFLARYLEAEPARLVRIVVKAIAAGSRYTSSSHFASLLGMNEQALFRALAAYKVGAEREDLGRFDGYVDFLERLETERLAQMSALGPSRQRTFLEAFSVWRLEGASARSNHADFRSRVQALHDRDRPRIQRWVQERLAELPQGAGGEPPAIRALAQHIMALPAGSWRDIFPGSLANVSHMLVGTDSYSPDISHRWIFSSREELYRGYNSNERP